MELPDRLVVVIFAHFRRFSSELICFVLEKSSFVLVVEHVSLKTSIEFVEVDTVVENVSHDKMIHDYCLSFDTDRWWGEFNFNFFFGGAWVLKHESPFSEITKVYFF